MAAPAVQSIQDIIAQLTAATKPQQDVIDQQTQANDQAGTAQVAGLDAAKTNTFGDITQAAVNRGGYFSGFAPDAEAKYTGATYLPALAALQGKIADTRNSLLGKKADLVTGNNTRAIDLHQTQQSAYDQWVQEQEKMAFQAHQADLDRQAAAATAAANRAASASSAANKAPSATQVRAALLQDINDHLTASTKISTPGYAEQKALPELYGAYAPYGLSAAQINDLYYSTRAARGLH